MKIIDILNNYKRDDEKIIKMIVAEVKSRGVKHNYIINAILNNFEKDRAAELLYLMSEAYYRGESGTEKIWEVALQYAMSSRDLQHIKATYRVGKIHFLGYYHNEQVLKDMEVAETNFRDVLLCSECDNGLKNECRYYLAQCLWEQLKFDKSKFHFNKVENGSKYYLEAQYFLGVYYKEKLADPDYNLAFKRLKKAKKSTHYGEEAKSAYDECKRYVSLEYLKDEEKIEFLHKEGQQLWDKLGDTTYKAWKNVYLPKPIYFNDKKLLELFLKSMEDFVGRFIINPSLPDFKQESQKEKFAKEFFYFLFEYEYNNNFFENLAKKLLPTGILYSGDEFEDFSKKFMKRIQGNVSKYSDFIKDRKKLDFCNEQKMKIDFVHYLDIEQYNHTKLINFLLQAKSDYIKKYKKDAKVNTKDIRNEIKDEDNFKGKFNKVANKLIIRSVKESRDIINKEAVVILLAGEDVKFIKFLKEQEKYEHFFNLITKMPALFIKNLKKFESEVKNFPSIDSVFYLNLYKNLKKLESDEDYHENLCACFRRYTNIVEYNHLPDTFVYEKITSPADMVAALKLTHRSHVRYAKSETYHFFTNPKVSFEILNESFKKGEIDVAPRNKTHGFQRIYCFKYGAVSKEIAISKNAVETHYVKGFRKYSDISTDFISTTTFSINSQNEIKDNTKIDNRLLLSLIENIFKMHDEWFDRKKLSLTLYQEKKLLSALLPFVFCNYYLEAFRNPAHMIIHPLQMHELVHVKGKKFNKAVQESPMSDEKATSHSLAVHNRFLNGNSFFEGVQKISTNTENNFKKKELEILKLFDKKSIAQLVTDAGQFWTPAHTTSNLHISSEEDGDSDDDLADIKI